MGDEASKIRFVYMYDKVIEVNNRWCENGLDALVISYDKVSYKSYVYLKNIMLQRIIF